MILIQGIVSHRDGLPYVQIDIDGHMVQCSMVEARNVSRDIESSCARAEADAIIWRFFSQNHFPQDAAAHLMVMFRDFRAQLDTEAMEKGIYDPDLPPES